MNTKLILIVDDEPDICTELGIYLTKRGYTTITAENGEAAIELFTNRRPIVVISDYKMPGMNGVALLKEIKKIDKDIHVILMSGVADSRIIVEAVKADAFDFLSKPIDLKKLNELVHTCISRTEIIVNAKKTKKMIAYLGHEILEKNLLISIFKFNIDLDQYVFDRYMKEYEALMLEEKVQKYIIFDMKNVKYMNNVGLDILVKIKENLEERDHHTYMCNVNPAVKNMLIMLGYTKYFNVETTIEQVLSYFK